MGKDEGCRWYTIITYHIEGGHHWKHLPTWKLTNTNFRNPHRGATSETYHYGDLAANAMATSAESTRNMSRGYE